MNVQHDDSEAPLVTIARRDRERALQVLARLRRVELEPRIEDHELPPAEAERALFDKLEVELDEPRCCLEGRAPDEAHVAAGSGHQAG